MAGGRGEVRLYLIPEALKDVQADGGESVADAPRELLLPPFFFQQGGGNAHSSSASQGECIGNIVANNMCAIKASGDDVIHACVGLYPTDSNRPKSALHVGRNKRPKVVMRASPLEIALAVKTQDNISTVHPHGGARSPGLRQPQCLEHAKKLSTSNSVGLVAKAPEPTTPKGGGRGPREVRNPQPHLRCLGSLELPDPSV
eukprot:2756650-Alexandrium_andersonii.AAC.1